MSKATDIPTITIEQAYKELPYASFATWIRLMVATPKQLSGGRAKLAQSIGIPETSLQRHLADLEVLEYIKTVRPERPGMVSEVVLLLRPVLSGPTYFVNLSNTRPLERERLARSQRYQPIETKGEKRRGTGKGGYGGKGQGVNMQRVRAIYLGNRKKAKDKRERGKDPSVARVPRPKGGIDQMELDWVKLDQRGKPAITFSPSEEKRTKMIEVLDRDGNDPVRIALVNKLASEMVRIYTRYRRMVDTRKKLPRLYDFDPKNLIYAKRTAINCIREGITPRDLIAYWHKNIGMFNGANLTIPPITFLSSRGNIKTAACNLDNIGTTSRPEKNSFRLKNLHPKTRSILTHAGFNVDGISDEQLIAVQLAAKPLSQGERIFIDRSIKPMAEWLAKVLYRGKKERES